MKTNSFLNLIIVNEKKEKRIVEHTIVFCSKLIGEKNKMVFSMFE